MFIMLSRDLGIINRTTKSVMNHEVSRDLCLNDLVISKNPLCAIIF